MGYKHNPREKYREMFGEYKPCLHGSDAHTFEYVFKPDLNRYCWIKGELTFSGFKQVIYEPDSRVSISERKPGIDRSTFTVTGFAMENTEVNENLQLPSQPICINEGLVTIIGGKGDGKTALLDLIANCFEDRCKRGKKNATDNSSFIQRIEKEKPNLLTKIQFKKGDEFTKTIFDEDVFESTRVTYMPQGKIDEYSSDTKKLHTQITELIFNSDELKNSSLVENYQEIGIRIEEINTDILGDIGRIETLERETRSERIEQLHKELELKKGELEEVKSRLNGILLNDQEVTDLDKERVSCETKLKEVQNTEKQVNKLKREESHLSNLNTQIVQVEAELKKIGWEGSLPRLRYEEAFSTLTGSLNFIEEKMASIETEKERINLEIRGLSERQQYHTSLLEELTSKEADIEQVSEAIDNLTNKSKSIDSLLEGCTRKYLHYIKQVAEQAAIYNDIIQEFVKDKDKIISAVDFKGKVVFDRERFKRDAESVFYRSSAISDKIEGIISIMEDLGGSPTEIKLDEYQRNMLDPHNKLKPSRTKGDLYRAMLSPYFSLETEVFFEGKPMHTLSMGQKGTVLLTIFLAEGNHLLILDQPEENLDNRFIYEVLVHAIREAKKKRQIIMATHNANLVVNTDADQIIIAKNDNGRISYISGALENNGIREEVTTLLEGGLEAFQLRERRYRN